MGSNSFNPHTSFSTFPNFGWVNRGRGSCIFATYRLDITLTKKFYKRNTNLFREYTTRNNFAKDFSLSSILPVRLTFVWTVEDRKTWLVLGWQRLTVCLHPICTALRDLSALSAEMYYEIPKQLYKMPAKSRRTVTLWLYHIRQKIV